MRYFDVKECQNLLYMFLKIILKSSYGIENYFDNIHDINVKY